MYLTRRWTFAAAISLCLLPSLGMADEVRFFAGARQTRPQAVNTELASQSLPEFGLLPVVGVDATYSLGGHWLGVGVRGTWGYSKQVSQTQNSLSNPDYARLRVATFGPVVRLGLVQGGFIRLDAWGAYDLAFASVEVNTASPATYDRSDTPAFAGPEVGASLALGAGNYFLFSEAAYSALQIRGLTRLGASNNAVDRIDLKGAYVTIGIGVRNIIQAFSLK